MSDQQPTAQQESDRTAAALQRIGLGSDTPTVPGGGPINPATDGMDALYQRTQGES